MTAPELKTCPFCGGEAITSSSVVDRQTLYAHCKDHTCPGWSVSRCLPVRWNHRADLAAPAQGRVKPLVWDRDGRRLHLDETMQMSLGYDWDGYTLMRQEAYGLGCSYIIWPDHIGAKTWNLYGVADGIYVQNIAGEEAAKAAAQADYEARILAALEPQPDPRDEVIARLVEALEHIRSRAISTRGDQAYREFPRFAEKAARAPLAAAKAVQHG